jgi:anti-sigma regulatory factor (Ser/Thr protein kinase)
MVGEIVVRLALDLNLPADARLLGPTRKALGAYIREFGAPSEIVDDVILAVDEACSNVMQHAYPPGRDNNFLLRAELQKERIVIEVVDDGVGFDGFDLVTRRPGGDDDEPLAPRGRGLEVMRRLMTTVEVESPTATGGTRLRLVRLLPSSGE